MGNKWTGEEEKEMIDLYKNKKKTLKEIAEKLGRTVKAVDNKLKNLGVERKLKRWSRQEIIGLLVDKEQLSRSNAASRCKKMRFLKERKNT